MKHRFSRIFLLLSGIFYVPALFAQNVEPRAVDAHVTLNTENPSYTNSETLTTQDGFDVWLDGIKGFNGTLINSGNLLVTGTGYGVYETPYQTRPVSLHIKNTGTIQRIQLEETKGSIIENGNPTQTTPTALIQGSVLLGVNSKIYNDSGIFENFDLDTEQGLEKGNLISLGRDSQFINGNIFIKQTQIDISTIPNPDGETLPPTTILLDRPVYTNAILTTNHVQFAERGYFENNAFVNNKSFTFGDNGTLKNTGMAYYTTLSDTSDNVDSTDTGGSITTEIISFANNGRFSNEMGSSATVDTLIMGANATLINGDEYTKWGMNKSTDDYYKLLTLIKEGKEEEHYYNPVPLAANLSIKNALFGENANIQVNHHSRYTGETITAKNNSKLNLSGSTMTLTKENDDSFISMGDNSSITLGYDIQGEITEPQLGINPAHKELQQQENGTFIEVDVPAEIVATDEVFIPEKLYTSKLDVDTIAMGNQGNLSVDSGSTINSKNIYMKDNASVYVGPQVAASIFLIPQGQLNATEKIILGNTGTLTNEGRVTMTDMIFGHNGTIINKGPIIGETLTMDHDATINTYNYITPFVTVGSNSVGNMLGGGSPASDIVDKDEVSFLTEGAFVGGFTKANGATNVNINSNVGFKGTGAYYHGWLAGGVNVDSITIQQGELWGQDDIRGRIDIAKDSTLRLVGTDVTIYDPIRKLENATNTKLIVDLDGSDNFYKTLNTVDVDTIYVLTGGFQIQTPVTAEQIIYGSNSSVRLRGNYYVGDMTEWKGEAVNTSLLIDAGTGNSINSTGIVRLDRVVVESGTFNINHQIEAVYTADNAALPSANEQGMEIGTDAVANVNAADVKVNRIVRDQLALRKGEDVTNTTVNMNGGHLWVERNTDFDKLNINSGTFEFMNKDEDNVVNISDAIHVGTGGQLAGDGIINLKSGALDVDNAGRLSVSTQLVSDKNIGTMQIVQSEQTYSDASDITNRGHTTVNMAKGSIIDLRANGDTADKIDVSGTVNLADGTRIIVRDIQAGTEYELMSATQLNGNMDQLSTSFLWTGKEIKNKNNTLSLKVNGIQTLNEGISSTQYSKNVWTIAEALTAINDSTASNTVDPFLDNVFYAHDAETAVNVMDEYSPEGYLNAQQAALRTNRTFRQSALSELDAMRTYRDIENMYQGNTQAVYNPNYYGRPGMEAYYARWNAQQNARRRTRTDKGGLWAKPFAVSVSQDDVKNMSGYDISSYGFAAGIDRRFGALSMGLMGMYASGSIDQNNKVIETDTTSYGVGVYGQYRPYRTRQFFDFYALWSQTKNESTHKINSLVEHAKADFDMTAYSVGADMGYDMPLTRNIIITPKVGIDYSKIEADEITEKGTGVALLKVKADDLTSIQMPVEIKAAFNYGNEFHKFKPEVHARWTHEFGDTESSGQGLFVNHNQPFAVKGLSVDKDVFTLGGSLLWLYNVSELELRYDYDFSSSSTGHTVNVGYKYLF